MSKAKKDEKFADGSEPQPGHVDGELGPDVQPIDGVETDDSQEVRNAFGAVIAPEDVGKTDAEIMAEYHAARAAESGGVIFRIDPDLAKQAAADAEAKKPNIIFVGKRQTKTPEGETVTVDAEPPKSLRAVREVYELPSADEQLNGFYHPQAPRIRREFPTLYKEFTTKGGSN